MQRTTAILVECAEDAARYGLRPGRPIGTTGYDKRFCFEEAAVANRVRYVERQNESHGWRAKPWPILNFYEGPFRRESMTRG